MNQETCTHDIWYPAETDVVMSTSHHIRCATMRIIEFFDTLTEHFKQMPKLCKPI